MFNLSEKQLQIVKDILKLHLPHLQVLAFGSRVTGNAKPHSDLDLAIVTTQPLSIHSMGLLKEAFASSDLAVRVDIVDLARTEKEFKELILKNSTPVLF